MITTPFLLNICRIAGTGLAITSLWLTGVFGASISFGIMCALVVVSFMASYMWCIAAEVSRHAGNGWMGKCIKALAVVVALGVTVTDALTNASTTGANRVSDVHAARVQTTNATNAAQELKDARALLAMQKKRLGELTGSNGWQSGVTPDEMKSRLATITEAIRQETNRGGCGPKCLALQKDRDALAATLGVVTEHNLMLSKIEGTQNSIKRLTKEVAETPPQVSNVDVQNKKLASIFTLDRKPGEGAYYWTDTLMMVVLGGIITLASQFFNMLAWLPASGKETQPHRVEYPQSGTSVPSVTQLKPVSRATSSAVEIVRLRDMLTPQQVAI